MPAIPAFFLVRPVDWTFTALDRFNAPRNYTFAPNKKQLHEGIDLAVIKSDGNLAAILAAQRGIVREIGFAPQGYGNYVRIHHAWPDGGEWYTWYGHMSQITVSVNQFVLAGQKIGVGGSTGFSTGPHLHLTLQHIGHGLAGYTVDDVVDPEGFFMLGTPPALDEATYLADVTIPDGTVMRPGETFRKIWRIRNSGNTTWSQDYKLGFAGFDDQMGGPGSVALPRTPVKPGETLEVAVPLVTPSEAGIRRSTWQLRHPDGDLFLQRLYAEIEVKTADTFDRAAFVADVTIEDGTIIQPGQQFVKTWRIRNTGTTTWSKNYTLRFAGDEQMNAPNQITLPQSVKPDGLIDVSVTLTAPATPGRHLSSWKLFNAQGQPFDLRIYAEIRVPEVVTPTGVNELRWVADVTVPDNTVMQPGQRFVKTWRVRNSGTTTWGAGYTLSFSGDEKLSGPDSVPLPLAEPGDTVEVSVTLTAPAAPGTYKSSWKPRDPSGKFFEYDVFALIEVAKVQQKFDELRWVADVTVEDGTMMRPGQEFVKTWRVRNTGTTTWGSGYTLGFFGDEKMSGPNRVTLPAAAPGGTVDVSVVLHAPMISGTHKSTWKPRDPQGRFFDYDLFALINVFDPSQPVDLLPYLRGDGHLYDLEFNWNGGGRERLQTQTEGDRFYHVKNSLWEELWSDSNFIYRGTDTSAGNGEVYTLMDQGRYGSPWLPRPMTIGVPFRRTPEVVFRRKTDGVETHRFVQITWITLDAIYANFQLPNGVSLADVAVLSAYEDINGQPFERYYYAKKYGLVAWTDLKGRMSQVIAKFIPGNPPDNVREVLPWLVR